MKLPRQCAILVGGLGTRLGALTAETPKPLLDCGGRPFLAWVLRELCRFGIEDVVLLAGYRPDRVKAFAEHVVARLPKPLTLRLSVEPERADTGGALWHARELLDDSFMLLNGDSWLDTNLAGFLARATGVRDAIGHMLLRRVEDTSRYGRVELQGGRIAAFHEKAPGGGPGLINGGIYVFGRDIVSFLAPGCSLEKDVLPVLSARGLLAGEASEGYFIDIGTPADFARAQNELPGLLLRRAVFFDRDGVLNEDLGWVGSKNAFHWMPGAREAIRAVNDAGYHAFLVTNQAGVAKGFYSERDVAELHGFVLDEVRAFGATIDDVRYCPFHPEAKLEAYRRTTDWRKPGPGMINDLVDKWQVIRQGSFLIGDKYSDLEAARAAQIADFKYCNGDLSAFVHERIAKAGAEIARG